MGATAESQRTPSGSGEIADRRLCSALKWLSNRSDSGLSCEKIKERCPDEYTIGAPGIAKEPRLAGPKDEWRISSRCRAAKQGGLQVSGRSQTTSPQAMLRRRLGPMKDEQNWRHDRISDLGNA